MVEYKNNPAIFDRLNFVKNNEKVKGLGSMQTILIGNGDELTEKQLSTFSRELKLRKAARFVVFVSIPALTFYYKRNFTLGALSVLFSNYLARYVYNLSIFDMGDSFTNEFYKKSLLNHTDKLAAANLMIQFNKENLKSNKFECIPKKRFIEMYRYR